MSPLLLATLVCLSCWFPTTQGKICEPNSRFPHPLNCSWFILCDEFSKAVTLPCPDILHFNANMSYCDWPANAKCDRENKGGTVGLKYNTNVTDGDSEKESEIDLLNRMHEIIENLHNTVENENATIYLKDTQNKTENSQVEMSESKGTQHKESRKKSYVIKTQSNYEDAKEGSKSRGNANGKEIINGTDTSNTSISEITDNNRSVEYNKTHPAQNVHTALKRQVEHKKEITKEQETLKEPAKHNNNSKEVDVGIPKISKTYNHTSEDDLRLNTTKEINVTSTEDDVMGMNATGPGSDRHDYRGLEDNNNSSAPTYPYFDVYLDLNSPNEYLGYEFNSTDTKNITSQHALNATVKESNKEIHN